MKIKKLQKRSYALFLFVFFLSTMITPNLYSNDTITVPDPNDPWQGPPLATGHDKWLGMIYPQTQNFENYWNQVTPENSGKWGSVGGWGTEPDTTTWNWGGLDQAYNLAKDNGFPFRFHVLVWGGQQPGWINDLNQKEQLEVITNWFHAVNNRYDDIDYLEVVNEPLHQRPDGDTGDADYWDALGGPGETGWDWIIEAFRMAREIFPETTKLMINEYNVMASGDNVDDYLEIIELLQEEDLIDGIGMQGHDFAYWGYPEWSSTEDFIRNIDRLAATGLPIQVTEFDLAGDTDREQYEKYKDIFPALWNHPDIEGITLWGWEPGMWMENAYLLYQDRTERPALTWLRNYMRDTWQFGMEEQVGEGTVEPAIGKHNQNEGDTINLEATPGEEWEFSHWEGDVEDENSSNTTLTLESNYEFVKAVFTIIEPWQLIMQAPEGNGTVEPAVGSYEYDYADEVINISATPDDGWSFSHWEGDVENENNARTTITLEEKENTVRAVFVEDDTYIKDQQEESAGFLDNYPNPFNHSTVISYNVNETTNVSLKVYDSQGKLVNTLVNERKDPGTYSIEFKASDISSGVYFYRLEAGSVNDTKRMMRIE